MFRLTHCARTIEYRIGFYHQRLRLYLAFQTAGCTQCQCIFHINVSIQFPHNFRTLTNHSPLYETLLTNH